MPKRVNSAGQKKRNNRRESAAKTLKSLTHPKRERKRKIEVLARQVYCKFGELELYLK